jgi:hypothetical protein
VRDGKRRLLLVTRHIDFAVFSPFLMFDKKLRRGTHTSVHQLNNDIRGWINTWNDNPRPFVRTTTATKSSNPSATTADELMTHDARPNYASWRSRRANAAPR